MNRVLFGSKPSKCQSQSNESTSQRAPIAIATSPRVLGCNCHRIRSRTEIGKAFSEAHIEVGTLGFDFVKGAETKKENIGRCVKFAVVAGKALLFQLSAHVKVRILDTCKRERERLS